MGLGGVPRFYSLLSVFSTEKETLTINQMGGRSGFLVLLS